MRSSRGAPPRAPTSPNAGSDHAAARADHDAAASDDSPTLGLSELPTADDTTLERTSAESPVGRARRTNDSHDAPDLDTAETRVSGHFPRAPSTSGASLEAPHEPTAPSPAPLAQSLAPLEALRHNEMARTRRVAPLIFILVGVAAAAMTQLHGHPRLAPWTFGALATIGVAAIWLRLQANAIARYHKRAVLFAWYVPCVGFCVVILYFGVFSPAPIVAVLAVFFIGLGWSNALAVAVYATLASFQAIAAGLLISGTIVDPGLIRADALTQREQCFGALLIQLVMWAAFILARTSRQEILTSFEQLRSSAQAVAQREALVHEVREDFARAMRLGGPGGLTGQLLGSFQLGPVIGRGGMGEVYQAAHIKSGQAAAVKVLQASLLGKEDAARRFLREVDVARALDAPNIVRVLEVGGEETQVPYLAMELLRGRDLAHYLRTRRRLDIAQVLRLVREVGRGIHAAGVAGIVHRDLKPHNLFLAELPDGTRTWKILDFGVSTLASHTGTITKDRLVGTPAYMAPEQARGHRVDHRTDLYALATIAYRSLTGHPPFAGRDLPAIIYNVVHTMPRRPSLLGPFGPDLDAALAVGMAKNPDERFSSAAALADALEAASRGALDPAIRARGEALQRLPVA